MAVSVFEVVVYEVTSEDYIKQISYYKSVVSAVVVGQFDLNEPKSNSANSWEREHQ